MNGSNGPTEGTVVMMDLLFVAGLAVWAAVVGSWLLEHFGPPPDHRLDRLALAWPLGLGALALGATLLGAVGLLHRVGLASLLLGILAVALRVRFRGGPKTSMIRKDNIADNHFQNRESKNSDSVESSGRPDDAPSVLGWFFDATLALVLIGTLLTALTPPTDGDALCYHLQVPKIFLEREALLYAPDLHETVYPLVTEMLYAVALAFRDPVACRLVQWLLGLVFALNVTALGRPFLGNRARWAGTIALAAPAVSNGMGAPLNDVALAAFCAAALVAWARWPDERTLGSAALVGVLSGLAIGVKLPALVWVGLLGFGMLGFSMRARRFGPIFAFGATLLVVGGCWYVRAFVHTGNPVHPFFKSVFGSGFEVVLSEDKRPMPPTVWNIATSLWSMSLDPARFDSVSHQYGPLFLMLLPPLLLWRPPRRLGLLIGFAYVFLMLCLTQRQSTRFVLATVGPMAAGAAWLAHRWARQRGLAARVLQLAVAAVLLFEAGVAVTRCRHGFEAAVGLEPRATYLERVEPTYRVGRWVDRHLEASARIVGQDHRGFYIPRDYAMEKAHRRRTGLGENGESPEAIVRHFREHGFTHLLMCPPVPEDAVEFDPALGALLADWLAEREPIYRETITAGNGVTRRYALYELTDASPKRLAAAEPSAEEAKR